MIRALAYLWAAPTSCIGLVLAALALVSRGRARVVAGVLEAEGGALGWLLRRCVPLAGGAAAMTFGHVVLAQSAALHDACRAHERVHVRQCECWGPFFIPAYLIASLVAFARGGDLYRDNFFEKQASAICP